MEQSQGKIIRIGGGSAFFIDSALAVPQLLAANVDYIMFDYLAEGAMGLFGRMRQADEQGGYPSDFMDVHVGPFLQQIADKNVRIIANAGAVNPAGLASDIRKRIGELGLDLKVACISGDDLIDRVAELSGTPDMFTGAPLPSSGYTSINAYLGAMPIAAALADGADIIITGRAVDSALTLGPLIYEFGWQNDDWDRLAAGTVAGHLIECSGQATGGTFTDWRDVEGWANIGSPIAECSSDGSCVITKPENSGGLVSIGTVAEQLLYEVGDPQTYFVPDVTCDFTQVRLEQIAKDRVRVTGAKGYPATDSLKACATWDEGWRAIAYQPIIGSNARPKAKKQAAAMFERGNMMARGHGFADWRRTEAISIGNDEEIVLKLVVEHDEMLPCQMFAREQFSAISAMSPGTSVSFGVQVQPVMNLGSFLIPKSDVITKIDGATFSETIETGFIPAMISRPAVPTLSVDATGSIPLEQLAFARSGEKGEMINIAIIARDPEYLGALRTSLTEAALTKWFIDLGAFTITTYDVPGINAFNITLDGALPGGINQSQRLDPAAKSIAQRLMNFPVSRPAGYA
ncbi:MAG: acyclic terpene utilization AtuA family protein [Parasphingorhabdus sp.]|uniref:acyclic terpene utilization AtuA family protein n=1 Tax=Parasphingorhabdus sp. TaxID=2709688 RepID=UPI003265B7C6